MASKLLRSRSALAYSHAIAVLVNATLLPTLLRAQEGADGEPPLSISRSGANVTLAWPKSANGWVVETSDTLTEGSWSVPLGTTSVESTLRLLSFSLSDPEQFYRLSEVSASGTPEPADGDSDGDGLTDVEELTHGLDPSDSDSDGDGVPDGLERDWDQDTDGDGLINALDSDSDGDGLLDGEEDANQDGAHDMGELDGLVADSDGDGLTDGAEPDWDTDPDGDGLINGLDEDSDNDGLVDALELFPAADTDGDGTINVADPDSDDDGLTDGAEVNDHGTSPIEEDTDDDGAGDGAEIAFGTDALAQDTDGDGLRDGDEALQNTLWLELEEIGEPAEVRPDPDASAGNALLSQVDGTVFDDVLTTDLPPGRYQVFLRARPESGGFPELELRVETSSDSFRMAVYTLGDVGDPATNYLAPARPYHPGIFPPHLFVSGPVIPPQMPVPEANGYRWYRSRIVDLADPANLELAIRVLQSGVGVLVDRMVLVPADGDFVRIPTDPLHPDGDGDGIEDGRELASGAYWIEAEHLALGATQIRKNRFASNGADLGIAPGDLNLFAGQSPVLPAGAYVVSHVRAQRGSAASADLDLQIEIEIDGVPMAEPAGLTTRDYVAAGVPERVELYEWHAVGLAFRLEQDMAVTLRGRRTKLGAGEEVFVDQIVMRRVPPRTSYTDTVFKPVTFIQPYLDRTEVAVLVPGDPALAEIAERDAPLHDLSLQFMVPDGGPLDGEPFAGEWVPVAPGPGVIRGRRVTIKVPVRVADSRGKPVLPTNPLDPDTDRDGFRAADGDLPGSAGFLSDGFEAEVAPGFKPLDVDSDGDGIPDNTDAYPVSDDLDRDGIANGLEDTSAPFGLQDVPDDPDFLDFLDPDTDGDGLSDGDEVTAFDGTTPVWSTDPRNPDTDNDFLQDGKELVLGVDPLSADTDGDGVLDGIEDDNLNGSVENLFVVPALQGVLLCWRQQGAHGRDDQGFGNRHEIDPRNWDTDGDGLVDALDPDPVCLPNHPDLEISDVKATPESPVNGDQSTVLTALVENVGDVPVAPWIVSQKGTSLVTGPNILVRFTDGDAEDATVLGTVTIPSLDAGDAFTAAINVPNWTHPGTREVVATVEATPFQVPQALPVRDAYRGTDPNPETVEIIEARVEQVGDEFVVVGSYENNETSKTIRVRQRPAVEAGRYHGFSGQVYTGSEITFNGSAGDADGTVELYSWDFDGDGTSDAESTVTGVVKHTYAPGDEGHYIATLRVTDNDGLTSEDTTHVIVTDPHADPDGDGLTNSQETGTFGSDPDDPDSDDDGLNDGVEVALARFYRTSATEDLDGEGFPDAIGKPGTLPNILDPDSDEDGLLDGGEGSWVSTSENDFRWVGTSPYKADTDDDGLTDKEERDETMTSGILYDSDADGLSDFDEVRVWLTNPFDADTDDDMLPDGVDASPKTAPGQPVWSVSFMPGMLRYELDIRVHGLDGRSEEWNYDTGPGTCEKIGSLGSDGTLETPTTVFGEFRVADVRSELNNLYLPGGYRVVSLEHVGGLGTMSDSWLYGCDFWHQKGYKIIYDLERETWRASFKNSEPLLVQHDESADTQGQDAPDDLLLKTYTVARVAVEPDVRQSLHWQFTIAEADDRSTYVDGDNFALPAFHYKVFHSANFDDDENLPVYESTTLAAELGNHAFAVDFKIAADAMNAVDDFGRDIVLSHLYLQIMPAWVLVTEGVARSVPMGHSQTISNGTVSSLLKVGSIQKRILFDDDKEVRVIVGGPSELADDNPAVSDFENADGNFISRTLQMVLTAGPQGLWEQSVQQITETKQMLHNEANEVGALLRTVATEGFEFSGVAASQVESKLAQAAMDLEVELTPYANPLASVLEYLDESATRIVAFTTDFGQAAVSSWDGDSIETTLFVTETALKVLEAIPPSALPDGKTGRLVKSAKANGVLQLGIALVQFYGAVYEYGQNPNPIAERRLYERTWDIALDTGISFIPVIGATAELSWTGYDLLFGYFKPDTTAQTRRLAPSVGAAVRVLFQYLLFHGVPSAIAEDALGRGVDWANGVTRRAMENGTASVFLPPTQ